MTLNWHHLSFNWHHLWQLIRPFEYLFSLGIGGGAVVFQRYWQKVKEGRATGWPSADAVVQSATIKSYKGYYVEISYRYYVAQEYRYGKYRRHFRKKDQAEIFAESIRGRSLPVRYRQDNPSVSVLIERDLELAGAMQMDRQIG
jgi:Protein of unknown function (DUF3592)